MTAQIRVVPDPVLRRNCAPVRTFDPSLAALAYDMIDAMYAAGGYGLAAPQVGHTLRLFVVDVGWTDETKSPRIIVNPELAWASGTKVARRESCLSIPQTIHRISRPDAIRLNAQDIWGRDVEIRAEGMEAAIIQHEIDHLNGVLMTDHPEAPK